ncbi:hypothetical protein HXX25_01475 [Hyphobacterium sp. CCMP332]|uniref:hypothetical protein n=1 Tax=Hyphobacterium sp. CCMP332 TaxID=2749086 RepID=UPI001650CA7E|nr:hypothetical protein [Hyphobacterium sp. CCMP332]QNL18123.1 hypothetical protein HXX25_01475 [Hyphobacterium sp. CCMP332]
MTYEIKFPTTGNIVEVRLNGALSFETFRDMNVELYYGPEWQTGMNMLAILERGTDVSAIDSKVLRTEFKAELERMTEVRGPEFKVAWVAEDAHNLPILRLWQSMPFVLGVFDIEIFADRDSGRNWLEGFEADWPELRRPA